MKNLFIWGLLCISTISFAQEDFTVSVVDFETSQALSNITITLSNPTQGITIQKVIDELQRASKNAVFKMLNEGTLLEMGIMMGRSKEQVSQKNKDPKNTCLYCHHFLKCNKNIIFDENGIKKLA